MIDTRPAVYHYYKQLIKHIKNEDVFFNGKLIYPRQFEIHLPANHIKSCQLYCPHCAGSKFDKSLGTWEIEGLELLNKLQGKIPYHIYGGAYTEPLMNPYFMTYLATTKKYNNHFGIHTNGILLNQLEDSVGFLTELNRIATDKEDYLSISIDAGEQHSWSKTKGTKNFDWFNEIEKAISKTTSLNRTHAIRLCYLISPYSDSVENFEGIVDIAKRYKVDSLRFSIPFANYNQSFDKVKEYKANREQAYDKIYQDKLAKYLSNNEQEQPYIFYTEPEFTDIDRYTFNKCIYGYYQITFGADGNVYKCSTVATPTAKHCRLGKITSNLDEFNNMIVENFNENWDCKKMCFDKGLRCNRMGLEINFEYSRLKK